VQASPEQLMIAPVFFPQRKHMIFLLAIWCSLTCGSFGNQPENHIMNTKQNRTSLVQGTRKRFRAKALKTTDFENAFTQLEPVRKNAADAAHNVAHAIGEHQKALTALQAKLEEVSLAQAEYEQDFWERVEAGEKLRYLHPPRAQRSKIYYEVCTGNCRHDAGSAACIGQQ